MAQSCCPPFLVFVLIEVTSCCECRLIGNEKFYCLYEKSTRDTTGTVQYSEQSRVCALMFFLWSDEWNRWLSQRVKKAEMDMTSPATNAPRRLIKVTIEKNNTLLEYHKVTESSHQFSSNPNIPSMSQNKLIGPVSSLDHRC